MAAIVYFEELTILRKRHFLLQVECAKIFGIKNPVTISHWETGHQKPPEIFRRLILFLLSLRRAQAEEIMRNLRNLGEMPRNQAIVMARLHAR